MIEERIKVPILDQTSRDRGREAEVNLTNNEASSGILDGSIRAHLVRFFRHYAIGIDAPSSAPRFDAYVQSITEDCTEVVIRPAAGQRIWTVNKKSDLANRAYSYKNGSPNQVRFNAANISIGGKSLDVVVQYQPIDNSLG